MSTMTTTWEAPNNPRRSTGKSNLVSNFKPGYNRKGPEQSGPFLFDVLQAVEGFQGSETRQEQTVLFVLEIFQQ